MWRTFCAFAFFALGWVGSASGESLYLTLPPRPQSSFGANTSFAFIAPYITKVETTLSASISKTTAAGTAGNAGGAGNAQKQAAAAPTVSYAVYNQSNAQITYVVSCDLTSVLRPGNKVTVQGTKSSTSGDDREFDVTDATVADGGINAGSVSVTIDSSKKPKGLYQSNGVVTNVACPSGDAFTVALSVGPTALSRGYLYLRRNAFYDDSVDFSVGSDGMLSNSDTSSTQEITAILTELAQTAAAVAPGLGGLGIEEVKEVIKSQGGTPPKRTPELIDTSQCARLGKPHRLPIIKDPSQAQPAIELIKKLPREDLVCALHYLSPGDLADLMRTWPLKTLIAKIHPSDFFALFYTLYTLQDQDDTQILHHVLHHAEILRRFSFQELIGYLGEVWPAANTPVGLKEESAGDLIKQISPDGTYAPIEEYDQPVQHAVYAVIDAIAERRAEKTRCRCALGLL